MPAYHGSICPVCKEVLKKDEQIVVCPICGAAYHKACYASQGQCLFQDLHQSGEAYTYQFPEPELPPVAPAGRRICSRCGTACDVLEQKVCHICGSALPDAKPLPPQKPLEEMDQPIGQYRPEDFKEDTATEQLPYPPLPLSPFGTPFAGADPESELDGVKAKWLVAFLQRNSAYFMFRFQRYAKKMPTFEFNWAAMLFGPFYYLYRKMYGWAAIFGVVYLLCWIPSNLITVLPELYPQLANAVWLEAIFYLVWMAGSVVRLGMGLLANRLYYGHACRKIAKIVPNGQASDAQLTALSKKGGTGLVLPIVCFYLFAAAVYALVAYGLPVWWPELAELLTKLVSETGLF